MKTPKQNYFYFNVKIFTKVKKKQQCQAFERQLHYQSEDKNNSTGTD